MKHLLKNKWGITLLEGMIALGLLALAATASFGVLLSVSRKSTKPDLQEEMQWAIESAANGLQLYNGVTAEQLASWDNNLKGLCAKAGSTDSDPLDSNVNHQITCMLPPICDRATSSFSYTVTPITFSPETTDATLQNMWTDATTMAAVVGETVPAGELPAGWNERKNLSFDITCNGFTL